MRGATSGDWLKDDQSHSQPLSGIGDFAGGGNTGREEVNLSWFEREIEIGDPGELSGVSSRYDGWTPWGHFSRDDPPGQTYSDL